MTDVVPTSAQVWEDKEQELAAAKEVIVGEVPTIADLPDTMLTLPRGIPNEGKWHARCEVRELTGVDEEVLAKVRKPEETFDTMLLPWRRADRGTGPVQMDEGESRGWLNKLLIGERELLFLAIAKATYGDERKYEVTVSRTVIRSRRSRSSSPRTSSPGRSPTSGSRRSPTPPPKARRSPTGWRRGRPGRGDASQGRGHRWQR